MQRKAENHGLDDFGVGVNHVRQRITFMSEFKNDIDEMKQRLNAVSKSFCLAKWKQVTIHLQNGHTHSCHHPDTHHVPLEELRVNPSALHNTAFKKKQRQMMLNNQRPAECGYCWNIEDLPGDQISDRHIKSNDPWAKRFFDDVAGGAWDADVLPSYVEVSFSNKCNFKCAYCAPYISSKWMAEIKESGPYPTHLKFNNIDHLIRTNKMPIEDEDANPYVQAFWKWWPTLYPQLEVFRVTGGEPLLSSSTFKVLDFVAESPNPKMELAINSNLGVPSSLVEKLKERMIKIETNKSVKSLTIYTSIDCWGRNAELIRTGLDLELLQKNVKILVNQVPKLRLTFMCTFNLLSPPTFLDLIKWIRDLKCDPDVLRNVNQIILDISYLRHPEFLSAKLLPKKLIPKLYDCIKFMEANSVHKIGWGRGFFDFEIAKLRRPIDWIESPEDSARQIHFANEFKLFIQEYEKRRKFSFLDEFPDYQDLF
ncbi:MAG: twitch domain-containing radical SAM protein [Pseudobdellovibrionaceae bacterium]